MVARKIAVALMFGAACLMVTTLQAADKKKAQHGTMVSVDANKLVVAVGKDATAAPMTYDVSPNVSVTIKGEPAKITDLMVDKTDPKKNKIGFTLDSDGKTVLTIMQGHKSKN